MAGGYLEFLLIILCLLQLSFFESFSILFCRNNFLALSHNFNILLLTLHVSGQYFLAVNGKLAV